MRRDVCAGVLEYEKQIDFLRSTIKGVIERRRAKGVQEDDHDILSFMLRESGKEGKEWVDDHEIMMQTITFLLAGTYRERVALLMCSGQGR
jgi:cytochrome P450